MVSTPDFFSETKRGWAADKCASALAGRQLFRGRAVATSAAIAGTADRHEETPNNKRSRRGFDWPPPVLHAPRDAAGAASRYRSIIRGDQYTSMATSQQHSPTHRSVLRHAQRHGRGVG